MEGYIYIYKRIFRVCQPTTVTAAAPVAIPYLCRATQCCDAYRYELSLSLSLSLSLTVFQPHPFPLPVLLIFIVNVPFFRPLLPSRSLTVMSFSAWGMKKTLSIHPSLLNHPPQHLSIALDCVTRLVPPDSPLPI